MHGTGGAIKDIKISKKHDKGHQLMNFHSGFKVEISLDELFPLLSIESQSVFGSMAYTEHLIDGSHYLFLGT